MCLSLRLFKLNFPRMKKMGSFGKISVKYVFKAEEFQKAFDTLADRNSGAGKVVLTFA